MTQHVTWLLIYGREKAKSKVKVKLLLLYIAFTIIQYSRALYNSITPSSQAFFFSFLWAYSYTACSLTVGASDVFIAFMTEVPILHLGEVLYLRYRVWLLQISGYFKNSTSIVLQQCKNKVKFQRKGSGIVFKFSRHCLNCRKWSLMKRQRY